MANLNTGSLTSLVSGWASAAQGKAAQLVDFTTGSILRAIAEATAYVGLWLQGLILKVAALTRAATSKGADLDTWLAQFGFTRFPAVAATMQETFGRFTPTAQALIYPGDTVQSQDGSIVFAAIADTNNSNYNATLGAYVLPSGTTSISVTVQCTVAGIIGNVQANTINSLSSGVSGVDYVNNAFATDNGLDPELDSAVRARFVTWIASLEAATLQAVLNAIASVQNGMSGIIAENTQYNGSTQNGYFTAIVNDGSGTATSPELANAANAIEAVRPLTVTYGVHAVAQQVVAISMTLTTTGVVHSAAVTAVQAALVSYINGIKTTGSGATLPYTSLAAQAYAIPGVINVTSVVLNGGTADLSITYQQAFSASNSTVTVA